MDETKRELVRGWLTKASHDLDAARMLSDAQPALLDIAAFHCHQAVEKELKGFLAYWDQKNERSHDLRLLIDRVSQIEPAFGSWQNAAGHLTPLAIRYRYPDPFMHPEATEVAEAIDDSGSIYNQVLAFLPPDYHPNH